MRLVRLHHFRQQAAINAESFRALTVKRFASVGFVLYLLLCAISLAASEQQVRFFEQLRTRQLFGLAERYCLEELNRTDLPAHQRIELAYELSRTLVQHALVVPVDQQEQLWTRAREVLSEARTAVGQHERTLLLDLQAGFIPCTQGRSLKWQLELTPDDLTLRKQALSLLLTGIGTLTDLESVIKEKILRPAPKEILPRDKFIAPELRGLLGTLQFELGQAHLERAALLGSEDADRFASVDAAEKWLTAAVGLDKSSEFSLTCQIQLASCARLKINAPRALRLLDQVEAAKPSQAILDQVLAERARVLMMQQLSTDAADLLTKALKNRQPPPCELVALRVQVLIELWRTATEKQAHSLAKELDSVLDQQLESLKLTNPGYWEVYCESLVSMARDAQSLGAELAQLVRKAKGLYEAKQIPEAIAAYAAASSSAAATGKDDLAFDLAFTRASIEIEAGQFAEAAQSFSGLAEQAPQSPRLAEARFLAAYALGQVYFSQPTKANREIYISALKSQRQTYPEHPTFGEATWLLAQLEEKRLQNSVALRLYQQVPADHARGSAAAAASARCYDLIIARLRELKKPTAHWEAEAEAKLIEYLPAATERQQKLAEDQAALALHLSNIILQSDAPAFDKADQLLEWITRSAVAVLRSAEESARPKRNNAGLEDPQDQVVKKGDPTDPAAEKLAQWRELQRVATRLRIVSLAGQGRLDDAQKSLFELAETSPGELLSIISGLSKIVAQAQDKPRHQLGELQLKAALRLATQRAQLSVKDQRRLDQCIVEAYVAAGRYSEALEPYRALVQASPNDPVALSSLAQLLMKFGQRPQTEESLGIWKKLDGMVEPGTNAWFEGRLNIAKCELSLGHPEKAMKLIRVTKLLYPAPQDDALQQRFDTLQKECEAAQK